MTHTDPSSFSAKAARQVQSAEKRPPPAAKRKPLRRDAPPLPDALVPTADELRLRLAQELEYARQMLDQMGDQLSIDPLVIGRHVTALQSVDVVGQILGHIASVVRASDPDGAVERIGMDELKARLTRTTVD